MHIGSKIKKLREMKNISQSFVAGKLHIGQSSYSKIESGDVDLTFNRFVEIAAILDVEPEQIIGFNNENLFFNVTHNKKGIGLNINQLSQHEIIKAYENHIVSLRAEITNLKSVINKILGKNNPVKKQTKKR
jgi:transcriptional regulator with XRE-family HTH domain